MASLTSNGFELLCQVNVVDLIPVEKYRSLRTGLTVCVANVSGPLVNGYFCLGKNKVKNLYIKYVLSYHAGPY